MIMASNYYPDFLVQIETEFTTMYARYYADTNKGTLSNDVVSFEVEKSIGTDSGKFTLTLTRRQKWDLAISPNDLIIIKALRQPYGYEEVIIGLVDDCRKAINMDTENPERVVRITGRSLNKSIIQFDTGVVPETEISDSTGGYLAMHNVTFATKNSRDSQHTVWNNITNKFISYRWNNGKSLFDYLKLEATDTKGLTILDQSSLENYVGSLWALMKELSSAPFYELFEECYGGVSKIVSRPTPFNKEDWDKLTLIKISDEDIVHEELGRTDLETYTLFSVGGKTMFSGADPYNTYGYPPLCYEPYMNKFGVRRLHVTTIYSAVADIDSRLEIEDSINKLRQDLFNWNILNPNMFNGLIMVKGSSKYKIGQRILINSVEHGMELEFYVVGVAHRFVRYNSWVTILSVTRGISPNARFSEPWGKGTDFKSLFGTYDPEEALNRIKNGGNATDGYGTDTQVSNVINKIIQEARALIGKVTYVFGGYNPTTEFDCSSFIHYLYSTYGGIDLGRTTFDQIKIGQKIESTRKLIRGDVVFFHTTYGDYPITVPTHVGIYLGNDEFIHCIEDNGVIISTLTQPYYQQHYLSGRRVIVSNYTSGSSKLTGTANEKNMNKVFRGVIAGKANLFIKYGNKYGVDPLLAGAIACWETGNGTSELARNRYNIGGMYDSSARDFYWFSSVEEGIESMIRNLYNNYISQGLTTIEKIQKKYAPVGVANDPDGLNKNWVTGVRKYYSGLSTGITP